MKNTSYKNDYEAHLYCLRKLGVDSLSKLQKMVLNPKFESSISHKIGMDIKLILKRLNRKDLHRIKNMKNEYIDLLQEVNVLNTSILAQSHAGELNDALISIHDKTGRTGCLPGLLKVINWIDQAKKLTDMNI